MPDLYIVPPAPKSGDETVVYWLPHAEPDYRGPGAYKDMEEIGTVFKRQVQISLARWSERWVFRKPDQTSAKDQPDSYEFHGKQPRLGYWSSRKLAARNLAFSMGKRGLR